jgi:hypothetical protein
MQALSGDRCNRGMRAEIDRSTCWRIARGTVAFIADCFQFTPGADYFAVADSAAAGWTATNSGFVADTKHGSTRSLLDYGL